MQISELESRLSVVEQHAEKQNRNLDEHRIKLANQTQELRRLNKLQQTAEGQATEIANLKTKNKAAKEQTQILNSEKRELIQENNSVKAKNDELTQTNDSLLAENTALIQELATLKAILAAQQAASTSVTQAPYTVESTFPPGPELSVATVVNEMPPQENTSNQDMIDEIKGIPSGTEERKAEEIETADNLPAEVAYLLMTRGKFGATVGKQPTPAAEPKNQNPKPTPTTSASF
ncbi:MAG: hypothetical protein K0Q74_976 [Gammaproteobacteria bacterium]|nr:hypothetical protein [Gammaproteobacteria bacterium]